MGSVKLLNPDNAEILVLAGDIFTAKPLKDFPYAYPETDYNRCSAESIAVDIRRLFDYVSDNFSHVIMLAGNHEYYGGTWEETQDIIRNETSRHCNIVFLENQTGKISNYKFIVGTCWTDINKEDPLLMYDAKNIMNDYRQIKVANRGYRPLTPEMTVSAHKKFKKFLETEVENSSSDVVVLTHHAPSVLSTQNRNSDILSPFYYSDFSEYLLDNPKIKLWIHGHTHLECDYIIGETRVVSNPRGYYGYETNSIEFPLKTVELP